MHGDVLLRNAQVVDGTGSARRRADVLVQGDRIAAVGDLSAATASRTIDVDGAVASPGFIDTHVHTDMTLLDEPVHEALLRQGISTVIQGQDGLSYAPLSEDNLAMFRRYLAGLNGDASNPVRWETVAEYRSAFDRTVTLNTAYAIPHAALRLETVGFHDVQLSEHELGKAAAILEKGFEEGAIAFSTGLSYFPNTYGKTDEHVAFGRVAAAAGRPYVTHVRSVFDEPVPDWLAAGLEEAMEVGRQSGVAIHVSHFGPKPWRYKSVSDQLAPVDRAKAEGVTVTLEVYPYPSGNSFLLIHLPPWAHEGGTDALLELIRSGKQRERLVHEIETNSIPPFGSEIAYLRSAANLNLIGRSIDDIAAERGVSVGEMVLRLLDDEDLAVGARSPRPRFDDLWSHYRAGLMEMLQRGDYMIGSDAIPVAQYPHPRVFGTFPRVLRFARETGALSLEQAVHLMTGVPAATFGLTGRGQITPGAFADIAIFDPNTITDHATYEDPARFSSGVQHLLVNGAFVLDGGVVTAARPGRAVP